jgi:hypothetical protein
MRVSGLAPVAVPSYPKVPASKSILFRYGKTFAPSAVRAGDGEPENVAGGDAAVRP